MSKIGLTEDEIQKIQTTLDFLFFDHFSSYASFPRFEQTFQPLFPLNSLNFLSIFKSICGPKRKYITTERFLKSYLDYKKINKISKELKAFFDILFSKILKSDSNFIGKNRIGSYSYSTIKSCKNREFISNIQILTQSDEIKGINLTYDDTFENNMFPNELEEELDLSLDMNLSLVDEKPIKMKKIGKFLELKEKFYRDGVTHIFGNFDKNRYAITFLGFKCISGKTVFVSGKNNSNDESFLFGNFGKKFHLLKFQISENGINLFHPIFVTNLRNNFLLKKKFENLNEKDLLKDELILDEKLMMKLTNEEDIDKFINTPMINDDHFFDKKLQDEISGNDYKEIINKTPFNFLVKKENKKIEKINNINDALKKYENEKQKSRGIYTNNEGKNTNIKNLKGKANLFGKKKFNKKIKYRKFKFQDDENNKIKKWNGDMENINKINPKIFYKRKDNYIQLKNELARSIQKELLESESSHNKETLLEELFPSMKEIQGKNNNYSVNPNIKKKKLKKKQILIKKSSSTGDEIPFNNNQIITNEENNTIHSDAIQIFSDINNNQREDLNNIFNLTEKYYPQKEEEEMINNLRAKGYTYAPLNSNVPNRNLNNYFYVSNNLMPARKYVKNEYDPVKTKQAQNNWKKFNAQLKKVNGVYLLQTIGAVIKTMKILEQNAKGKNYLFVSEKIKLLKFLEDNEIIIDFLTKKNIKEEKDVSEDENEDILIPDEHPENITNISQLEQNINDIQKLLENKKLNEEQKTKLEKLKNLYLQQKNILIENETNKIKKEIIEQNKINIDKLIKEEEQKRNLIQKENDKIIEQMEQKSKIEEENSRVGDQTSKIEKKEKTEENIKEIKIYKDQKLISENALPWIDPLFKPEKNNLCPCDSQGWIFPDKVTKADVQGWNYYIWLRAEEIYDSKNYEIFEAGASFDDIIQGSLGDCYFLSVLGSLCTFPKLIEKLFYSKHLTKSKNHQYGIYFYINGIWKLILIDDYFPARNTSFKKFAFAYSTSKEIWVPLLEKAWAKINGCYAKVGTGGLPNEVFDICSEAYNEYILIKNKNKDLLWTEILEEEKKNYMMTAGTTKNTNNFKLEKIGLTPGHAYTVLGVLEINKEKVIKLRNPWGNFEFTGDWSDYSSKWTEELKKKYEFNKKNDGMFYMGYEDFLKYFITIGFAKIHPDYVTNNIKIKKEQNIKCQLIKIRVNKNNNKNKSVHSFIQLYQKNPRIILKDGTYQNTALCFIILVDSEFNYLISSSSNKMHIGIEYNLDPDKDYYIFSDLNYRYDPNNKGKNHGYRITSYSESIIDFENLTENNKYNIPSLLRKSMIDYVKKNIKKSKYNGMTIYVTPSYSDYFPFTIAYFENEKSIDHLIKLTINYKGDKGFCFYCDDIATEDDSKIEKELPGNGNNIVLIMKYTLSSIFSLNYIFITDKRTKEEKEIYQKKISENKLLNDNTNDIFKEQGEPISPNSELIQYVKETNNGYILGLENKGNKKLRCKLNIEGLTLTDSVYKGRGSPSFYIEPKEKKIFNANVIRDFEGDLSFQFISY